MSSVPGAREGRLTRQTDLEKIGRGRRIISKQQSAERETVFEPKVLLRLHPRLCHGHHCLSPAAAAENVSTPKFVKLRPFQHGNESKCEKIMFLRRNVWGGGGGEVELHRELRRLVAPICCHVNRSARCLLKLKVLANVEANNLKEAVSSKPLHDTLMAMARDCYCQVTWTRQQGDVGPLMA